MKFELKNIKYCEWKSEETHCYQATLYIDGKPLFLVGNDGYGGPDSIDTFGNKRWKDAQPMFDKMMKYIKGMPKIKTDWGEMNNDLDIICHDLLVKHLEKRDMKRNMKTKVLFTKDGSIYTLAFGDRPRQLVLDHIVKRYPKSTILNTLPESEAFELWIGNR